MLLANTLLTYRNHNFGFKKLIQYLHNKLDIQIAKTFYTSKNSMNNPPMNNAAQFSMILNIISAYAQKGKTELKTPHQLPSSVITRLRTEGFEVTQSLAPDPFCSCGNHKIKVTIIKIPQLVEIPM